MDTDAQRIIELRHELIDHSHRYYIANCPIISDSEYDEKLRLLATLEAEHPGMADPGSPTVRIGSPVPTSLRKVKHSVKMLSLDNVNSMAETMSFFKGHSGQEVTLEMKVDGLSLHLQYKKGKLTGAVTRGNGVEGEDVTENARTIRTIPLTLRKNVDIAVRGEVYWRLSAFTKFNSNVSEKDRYANPRNGASGIMRQHDSRDVATARLDFVAYNLPEPPSGVVTQEGALDYLEQLGFVSTMTLPVTRDMCGLPYLTAIVDESSLKAAISSLREYREALDLDTDGLVLKISSLEVQGETGAGSKSPKWAAAYKFPPEVKETRLNGVTIQIGKSGQITPVAVLEPVELNGVIVTAASLCNQDELMRLGIDIGDIVKVQRSGETIPKVVGLSRPSPTKMEHGRCYQLPTQCPCCRQILVRPEGMVHLYCQNRECPDQVFARLAWAVGKDALDIRDCGESTIALLMKHANVNRLSDLFTPLELKGIRPSMDKRIKVGIERAKKAPLWRKLSALCIPDIGKISCQDLAHKFKNLVDMIEEEKAAEVVGRIAAKSLVNFINSHIDEIERLYDLGLEFTDEGAPDGPLSGKVFCITGEFREATRSDLEKYIESKGGVVKGSCTRKVDFLLKGLPGKGHAKTAAAQKLGTPILDEDTFYTMMGRPEQALKPAAIGEEDV